MRLLFLSSEPAELRQTLKWLLRASIPCAVWRGDGIARYGVWVQNDEDFPKALRIRMLWAKPRPVAPWVHLLESAASVNVETQCAETPAPAGAQPEGGGAREKQPEAECCNAS